MRQKVHLLKNKVPRGHFCLLSFCKLSEKNMTSKQVGFETLETRYQDGMEKQIFHMPLY